MSRIGKKEILAGAETEAHFDNGRLSIKGPKGVLERDFRSDISIVVDGKSIHLSPSKETKSAKMLWGSYASHIKNMLKGVNEGFEKKLLLEGVGYRSEVKGDKLILSLGFSHPTEALIPEGLSVKAEKNVIAISGVDKELVGSFSAKIRALKKPEPYKGKGFRYQNEIIRRKQGKKSV